MQELVELVDVEQTDEKFSYDTLEIFKNDWLMFLVENDEKVELLEIQLWSEQIEHLEQLEALQNAKYFSS